MVIGIIANNKILDMILILVIMRRSVLVYKIIKIWREEPKLRK